MSKRYLVFEKPEASKTWTIAFMAIPKFERMTPADFIKRENAEAWVRDVHSKRLGWWEGKPNQVPLQAHIAEVELPGGQSPASKDNQFCLDVQAIAHAIKETRRALQDAIAVFSDNGQFVTQERIEAWKAALKLTDPQDRKNGRESC